MTYAGLYSSTIFEVRSENLGILAHVALQNSANRILLKSLVARDRVGVTGFRPSPLPHHRTCGFPHPAIEPRDSD